MSRSSRPSSWSPTTLRSQPGRTARSACATAASRATSRTGREREVEELFGVPTQQLLWILLAVFGAAALILGLSALRNRVSFRMAARNLPRRSTQTILIVLGLMLATMLFSASFTTGDTLTNSLRLQSLEKLGQVDVQVQADGAGASGQQQFGDTSSERAGYFDAKAADEVRDRLTDESHVSGVAPAAIETVPVTATSSDLSEPSTDVLGLDQEQMEGFDTLTTSSGKKLDPTDLGKDQIYLSADAAEGLDVENGDVIEATFAQKLGTTAPNAPLVTGTLPVPRPSELTVAGVYESGANPASSTSMVMPLQRLQERVGEEGMINAVLITHRGPAIEGAAGTGATKDALRELLEENDLQAEPVKKEAIDQADQGGETFTSIFLLFGQFSVGAGVLLIFLIFVMLAAERKHELGIARAVGMRRGHLMRMFAFEGALYALLASALGSVAGVGVG